MKQVDVKTTGDSQVYVVTAVFVKFLTVTAESESHAQDVAEEQGLLTGEGVSLSNWHAHRVGG